MTDKVQLFCDIYEQEKTKWKNQNKNIKVNDFVDRSIKWTSELESYLSKSFHLKFDKQRLRRSLYRPYVKYYCYFDRAIVHRVYQQNELFAIGKPDNNLLIGFSGLSSSKPFQILVTNHVGGFDLLEKTQYLPLYR